MDDEFKYSKRIQYSLSKHLNQYLERTQKREQWKLKKKIKEAQEKIKAFQNPNNLKVDISEENKLDYPAIVETVKRLKNRIPLSNMLKQLSEIEVDEDMKSKYIKRSENRCKDRFCLNCQYLLSNVRFERAQPVLDKFIKEGYYAAHAVLTQPNAKDFNINESDVISIFVFVTFCNFLIFSLAIFTLHQIL